MTKNEEATKTPTTKFQAVCPVCGPLSKVTSYSAANRARNAHFIAKGANEAHEGPHQRVEV